jgi:hypothetical protein
MRVYFQIIGTSADINTSPSLVLVCDDLKILFNAGAYLDAAEDPPCFAYSTKFCFTEENLLPSRKIAAAAVCHCWFRDFSHFPTHLQCLFPFYLFILLLKCIWFTILMYLASAALSPSLTRFLVR